MGQSKSKVDDDSKVNFASNLGFGKISDDQATAHYTPSFFPLIPVVNKHTLKLCQESWKLITKDEIKDGFTLSGITLFYTEFYELLEKFDTTGRFEAVLTMHSTGMNKIAAKGQILVRIMQYVLSIDIDHPKELQYSLYMLGKSHNHKQIRPWQYSIFVQTMINTLASRLGSNATHDVMSAWVNVFAFVMKTMLPPAIKGLIVETELNSNATAEFVNEEVTQNILEVEDEKEMAKSLGSRSLNGSRYGGSKYGGSKFGGSILGSVHGTPRGFGSSKY